MSLKAFEGDPEALKAILAAVLTKSNPPQFAPREAGYRVQFTPKEHGAGTLTDGNAIARYFALKGAADAPFALLPTGFKGTQVNMWVDAEERIRGFVHLDLLQGYSKVDYSAKVAEFLTELEATLKRTASFVVGEAVSLADIVLYSTLFLGFLPRTDEPNKTATWEGKYPSVKAWIERLAAMEPFQKAAKACGCVSYEIGLSGVAYSPAQHLFDCSGPIKLPVHGKRNIMVTSALPYVNNVPHLGNIIGCVLSADVYARYCRLKGHNVIYVCGTDEYGTATETKALEEGLTPRQICDKYNKLHAEIYEWFDIAFDEFGRTSTPKQTTIAQDIFHKVVKNNYTIEDSMDQLYCIGCQKFLADRFVMGGCPHCKFDDARGDQCDGCGKLLNPTELITPKCKVCKQTPEIRSTDHMFIDLPKLADRLTAFIDKKSKEGCWSDNSIQVTRTWLRDGLKPRCITRDLKWGTPVPMEKYKEKVFYVWFDAPIGYISITAGLTDNWEMWWKNPEEVQLYQFMGKDNIPFHTIIFPCTLLGANDNYTMLHHISVTEYLNYEDGKFSKSRGIGVFGDDAKNTGIAPEVFRFYLLSVRPESSDAVFSWDDFKQKNNNELLANLGNYVNRALTFTCARFDSKVPPLTLNDTDRATIFRINTLLREYVRAMESVKLREGLRVAMSISSEGNKYMQDAKPWEVYKTDPVRCGSILNVCLNITYTLAGILEPYMPGFSAKVLTQLNMPAAAIHDTFHFAVEGGHVLGKPEVIFKMITDLEVADMRKRFGEREDEFPLELRTGRVVSVENHPEADKLYVVKVDLGARVVQVCAGLREVYLPDDMIGRNVVVVCNLKTAKMRGVESQGMILCADDGGKLSMLNPGAAKPGTAVAAEGAKNQPKKIVDKADFAKVKMSVGNNGECFFASFRLRAETTPVTVPAHTKPGAVIR